MCRGLLAAAAAAGLFAGPGTAGGIDRAGQTVDIIFRDGNFAELSVAGTWPDVTGNDIAQGPPGFPPGFDTGMSYDNVADSFASFGFGIKYDLTERFSLSLIGQEDFGSDIEYGGDPASSLLGGTVAKADTYALALVGRYRINENFAVHGGVRGDRADGRIRLSGLAYGGLNGYGVDLDDDLAFGWLVGASYEIPDIALRVAVTYNSRIRHDFGTTETLGGASLGPSGDTDVDTPQSVNLDFQTGIAEGTLLFGSIRWAEWSEFEIQPERFAGLTPPGTQLVSLDDSITYELGLARRITDRFGASLAVLYDDVSGDDLVSPLAPTKGFTGVSLGGRYTVDRFEISGGVTYRWLGDANPETGTPDTARASFEDNTAVTAGLCVGMSF